MRFGLRGPRGIRAGDETLDIGVLQQIVETGQTRALAESMRHLSRPRRFELAAALNRWRALQWKVAEE